VWRRDRFKLRRLCPLGELSSYPDRTPLPPLCGDEPGQMGTKRFFTGKHPSEGVISGRTPQFRGVGEKKDACTEETGFNLIRGGVFAQ